jgi:hypothetical protein
MLPTPLAIAFSEGKPDSINLLYEVIRMNPNETVEIKFNVIRSAILRIASEKPEWFYTEGWLKEILLIAPTNIEPKANNRAGREHDRNGFEDDYFKDISRTLDA